ncbi:MAG: hypothetical protein A2Z35_05850 [Actinobacteria bacterium RBG_19FT_COMBO_36_27]|nr:MAG: hypothetical protein A2Z35_05850 [Actinobacteria bacterium RBG_19FT_COMBO_36_27]
MKLNDLLPLIHDEQVFEIKIGDKLIDNLKKMALVEEIEFPEGDMEIDKIRILGDEYTFVIHIELVNSGFEKELSDLINRHSLENGSDTPDFVLAKYLSDCLTTFNKAIEKRDEWYKFKPWGRLTNLENPERNGNDS